MTTIWRWLSKKNTKQLFVPADLTASVMLLLQTARSEDLKPQILCENHKMVWVGSELKDHLVPTPSTRSSCYPTQSKTAFPNKQQSLLLDNSENRNSSLGNKIFKSDFPTNHTQLVSSAMVLRDYGVPADFCLHRFQSCDFLHLPNRKSDQDHPQPV